MSNKQNDKWLEQEVASFLEAVEKKNWRVVKNVLKSLRSHGFEAEAEHLLNNMDSKSVHQLNDYIENGDIATQMDDDSASGANGWYTPAESR